MSDLLNKAITIAHEAHANQVDALGQLTINHVMRVMSAGKTEQQKIIGALHDLIEDTPWTIEALRAEGFPEEILSAVDSLSRREDEDYQAYIARVAENPTAVPVKLNDLTDNMDVRRLTRIGKTETERLKRYLRAWRQLTGQPLEPKAATREKGKFLEMVRKNHTRAYVPWTAEEEEQLEALFCEGKEIPEICTILGRGEGGIRSRIEKLELEEKYNSTQK